MTDTVLHSSAEQVAKPQTVRKHSKAKQHGYTFEGETA